MPPYAGESVEVAETTPFTACRGPESVPMARVVVVALVEVAFTVTRLVMVLEAAFTKMPSPAVSGER